MHMSSVFADARYDPGANSPCACSAPAPGCPSCWLDRRPSAVPGPSGAGLQAPASAPAPRPLAAAPSGMGEVRSQPGPARAICKGSYSQAAAVQGQRRSDLMSLSASECEHFVLILKYLISTQMARLTQSALWRIVRQKSATSRTHIRTHVMLEAASRQPSAWSITTSWQI